MAANLRNRRAREVRALTVHRKHMGELALKREALLHPDTEEQRPATRACCIDGERPCPFVSCKWHLYLDVSPLGSIKLNFPDLDPDELTETCALDVADRGGAILEQVGALMNITRERVRQLEAIAFKKLLAAGLENLVDG